MTSMPGASSEDTRQLLQRARDGEKSAVDALLMRHRQWGQLFTLDTASVSSRSRRARARSVLARSSNRLTT